MSIAPVNSFPPERSEASTNVAAVRPEAGPAAEKATPAVVKSEPKQEAPAAKAVPASYQLPQDVVELRQDPKDQGQVIIQYLDKAKNVILQVPSAQELAVERGIAQDFQEAAKLRKDKDAAATTSAAGEKTHGD